jgi:hypothetical protein
MVQGHLQGRCIMKRMIFSACSIFSLVLTAFGGVTGSISGSVRDKTGAVISGASVLALNVETGVKSSATTNAAGFYSFPALPVGHYNIQVQAKGFSSFEDAGLVLDVNSALRVDAELQVGATTEVVKISAAAAQVDTQSTQMGELIGGKEVVTLPLNGRDWTELMALQPGVAPSPLVSPIDSSYSAGTSEGLYSISGGRESANGFMVNGGNVEEPMLNGVSVVPNLDSIAEFRILTNNFDAEYGHYSGGMVNLVTKSGANEFHGDAFEFLRLTGMNARNYYNPASVGPKSKYIQNQFGGTFGGPVKKDKLFFFADYQGTRQTTGAGSTVTAVPSPNDRLGDLLDQAGSLTGSVTGTAFANTLSTELGYPVNVGEAFYFPACNSTNPSTGCVFPNAVIPMAAFNPVSANLLKYIPAPNVSPGTSICPNATGCYSNPGSLSNAPLRDDKGGIRVDDYTPWGTVSGYYHVDDYYMLTPDAFSVGSIGSTDTLGRSQLLALGDTKNTSSSSLNELRLSYTRNAAVAGGPASAAVDPASAGFTVGCNALGICPVGSFVTIPQVNLNTFSFGWPENEFVNRENTYQVFDNFTKIVGTHSVKFGAIGTLFRINMQSYYGNTGIYYFNGASETGLDFADFLLGAVNAFNQGQQLALHNVGWYYGIFAQDSWRVRKDLTFNYGLRWDVTVPWIEKNNRMEALVPGVQSATFPTAPVGWTVPGDPGVPRTVSPVRYGNVAPRVGLAYSPDLKGAFWQKLTGGAGKTSIRAGWGMFYTSLENWINGNGNGDAPYGYYYVNPTPSEFGTPYVDLYTGNSEGQRFPVPSSVTNASPSNPDANVPWATEFEPISSSPTYYYKNVIPYTESYMLSLQRALRGDTILNMSYVGTQGHQLMVIDEANPSNPALCLEASNPATLASGQAPCGPFSETGTFTLASGQAIMPRNQLGPNGGVDFGSLGWFRTMGHSSYNALEISMRHTAGQLTLLVGYTYSKSMDNSSAPGDQVYPFNPSLSTCLSAWDVRNNFVASYSYELPFDKAFGRSRLTRGWIVSGITRFATGIPVYITEPDDNSLTGNTSPGPTGDQDEPNYTSGQLLLNTNPRKGGTYFNTALFSNETLGQFGNAKRRFFHGPGTNNWDMALLKDLHVTESKTLEFRAELFNAFNHAQFNTPDGNILDSTFGEVLGAAAPRIGQLAVKFSF